VWRTIIPNLKLYEKELLSIKLMYVLTGFFEKTKKLADKEYIFQRSKA